MENDEECILSNNSKASYPIESLSQQENQSFQLILQLPICIASIIIGWQLLNECDLIKFFCIYLIIQGIIGIFLVSLRFIAIYLL